MTQAMHLAIAADEDIFSARRRWKASAPGRHRGNMFFRLDSQIEWVAVDSDEYISEQNTALRNPLTDPSLIPLIYDPFNPNPNAVLSVARQSLVGLDAFAPSERDQSPRAPILSAGRG